MSKCERVITIQASCCGNSEGKIVNIHWRTKRRSQPDGQNSDYQCERGHIITSDPAGHTSHKDISDKLKLRIFFVYLLWEKEKVWVGEGLRDREGERIPSRICTISIEPDAGLEPTNREIRTWAKVGHLTDGTTQVPLKLRKKFINYLACIPNISQETIRIWKMKRVEREMTKSNL